MEAAADKIAEAIKDAARQLRASGDLLRTEAERMDSMADYIKIGTYEPSIAHSIAADISMCHSNVSLSCTEAGNIIYRAL